MLEVIYSREVKDWQAVLARPAQENPQLSQRVAEILKTVREQGDAALREFTRRFDGVEIRQLTVSEAEMESAREHLAPPLQEAIRQAADNIRTFHRAQWHPESKMVETMSGVHCWRRAVPIQRVGLYIPGGSAPLFSAVLMLGIPARIAGCPEVYLCTPPGPDGQVHPAILYTAHLVGIRTVFRVGGAQAIAALAYGTETVPAVDKIFGPGNAYVTEAKTQVSTQGLAIDLPAGPSEVLVIADGSANPAFVAADLLSQAEHGPDSQVVLLTPEERLARQVMEQLEVQLRELPRQHIARQSLQHSRCIVTADLEEAVKISNRYAPEHLILLVQDFRALAERITNAGSVFLGPFTPEAMGDYASGTNHVLPTYGYARAFSGVSVESFLKWITFQELDQNGLRRLGPLVETLAQAEQLAGHARAVTIRLNQLSEEH